MRQNLLHTPIGDPSVSFMDCYHQQRSFFCHSQKFAPNWRKFAKNFSSNPLICGNTDVHHFQLKAIEEKKRNIASIWHRVLLKIIQKGQKTRKKQMAGRVHTIQFQVEKKSAKINKQYKLFYECDLAIDILDHFHAEQAGNRKVWRLRFEMRNSRKNHHNGRNVFNSIWWISGAKCIIWTQVVRHQSPNWMSTLKRELKACGRNGVWMHPVGPANSWLLFTHANKTKFNNTHSPPANF